MSWIRERDSHIITVDQETFISDDRFETFHRLKDSLWTLKVGFYYPEKSLIFIFDHFQIKHVSARDAGRYECQVSTVPKISHWVDLVVVVPKVRST